MKQTQCEAILAYLRKHKRATNMELVTNLRIASPWRRIADMSGRWIHDREAAFTRWVPDAISYTHRITRSFIKTPSGKRVVQYRLERV